MANTELSLPMILVFIMSWCHCALPHFPIPWFRHYRNASPSFLYFVWSSHSFAAFDSRAKNTTAWVDKAVYMAGYRATDWASTCMTVMSYSQWPLPWNGALETFQNVSSLPHICFQLSRFIIILDLLLNFIWFSLSVIHAEIIVHFTWLLIDKTKPRFCCLGSRISRRRFSENMSIWYNYIKLTFDASKFGITSAV